MMDEKARRIVDANINRISEGLRVAEDIFRYGLNCASLQQSLKALRHGFMSSIDRDACIDSRAPLDDVGYSSQGKNEYDRADLRDVVSANIKRAEEGLRVLEEIFKLEAGDGSMTMKQLRYELYDLEKKANAVFGRKTLERGLILVMADPHEGYEELALMAVRANVPAVQMRQTKGNDREFISNAKRVRELTEGTNTLFIVDGRLDIARICNADGIHLGQNDAEPKSARGIVGEGRLIGLSTYNLKQVEMSQDEPVDYILFGPVWMTDAKCGRSEAAGVGNLSEAVRLSRHPVVAFGGINSGNLAELSGTGINNIALSEAVQDAADPYGEMRFFNSFGRQS